MQSRITTHRVGDRIAVGEELVLEIRAIRLDEQSGHCEVQLRWRGDRRGVHPLSREELEP